MNKLLIKICCILLIAVSCVSCGNNSKIPPLRETFSKSDKNPFGSYVFHQQVEQLYNNNSINDVNKNFASSWRDISDTGALYINISKNFFLSKPDLSAVLSFVYAGNSLFLSSDRIDKALLDTLGCTINNAFYGNAYPEMKYTAVGLTAGLFSDSTMYRYFYFPFYNHFSKWGQHPSAVLGSNSLGANFIVVFYGKGRFYLHTEPRALSNYFLLQKDNYQYFRNMFSFTSAIPEHVYWDDYYNKRNYPPAEKGNKSTLSVLLQYPAMAWGFWLLILLLVLYILFGGKRRQRIVDTIKPNTNTTLAFTETIGRLYLQKKDNRNIADKLITYFMEHIRNQFYLNTSQVNDEFIATVARKANSSKDTMDRLFNTIRDIQQSHETSDQQLLSLNQQLEKFYKKKI